MTHRPHPASIRCPICQAPLDHSRVVDSRVTDHRWRRRVCKSCDFAYTTIEVSREWYEAVMSLLDRVAANERERIELKDAIRHFADAEEES